MQTTISKVLQPLFKDLTERQEAVLSGRFGLVKNAEPETLEAIGKRFGVTRERVRQIEAVSLTAVREKIKKNEAAQDMLADGKKSLKNAGGVAAPAALVASGRSLVSDLNENHLAFLVAASGAFSYRATDKDFAPLYYLDGGALKAVLAFTGSWTSFLRPRKSQLLSGTYDSELKSFAKEKGVQLAHAENFLSLSKKIHANPFGDKGLTEWAEVRPRTIRDRIYLVLKKQGEPIHFQTIASEINKVKFDARTALASTVHNELIKDERFVLVGRGTYGLREHGYEPGTAKEVIHRILKKKGPMKSKDIVEAVQKERLLKQNTILVNLQNRSFFERTKDGVYRVREA